MASYIHRGLVKEAYSQKKVLCRCLQCESVCPLSARVNFVCRKTTYNHFHKDDKQAKYYSLYDVLKEIDQSLGVESNLDDTMNDARDDEKEEDEEEDEEHEEQTQDGLIGNWGKTRSARRSTSNASSLIAKLLQHCPGQDGSDVLTYVDRTGLDTDALQHCARMTLRSISSGCSEADFNREMADWKTSPKVEEQWRNSLPGILIVN